MPQIGYGTWQVREKGAELVGEAIAAGYRSIDTAAAYGNERGVGEGMRAGGVPRDRLFITTKLWNTDHGYDETMRAFDASLERLGLDYVDLYLIHWPVPKKGFYSDSWRAMTRLREQKLIRSIGVSNFLPEHVERLVGDTGVTPVLNQIELHPRFQQRDLRAYHAEHDIRTESWSPLGRGGTLGHPTIGEIARKHDRTPGQIVIRWHLDLGLIIIPKASDRGHMIENISVGDFRLDADDMAAIAAMDDINGRIGPDPRTFQ